MAGQHHISLSIPYLAGGLENAGWDVVTDSLGGDDHVGLVGHVEVLGGRVVEQEVRGPDHAGLHADVLHSPVVAL